MTKGPFPERNPWHHIGGPAPLFNRLTDENLEAPSEPTPLFIYTKDQVIESVIKEASNILNTRCVLPYKDYEAMAPSTLTYGIPDLYGFFDQSYADPSRPEDVEKLCAFMANALEMFDPRIKNVSVSLQRYDQANQTAHMVVNATLKLEQVVESISFPVLVDQLENLGKPGK